ncbi:MAG: NAD(P)-dependent oxidoreductase [Candidatus Bathyarchaeia archaeon]
MRVLLVGGSGYVGTFITPYLKARHELRVFDTRPPKHKEVEYVEGSVTDPDAVSRALDGMESLIWLVMWGPHQLREGSKPTPADEITGHYNANTLGLHLVLWKAQGLGIKSGVYTSTVTVHDRSRKWYWMEEDVPLDNESVYGLTKGFGELICRYFCRYFDMSIISLRITGPRTREQWIAERRKPKQYPGGRHLYVTDEEDLANAYLAALEVAKVGHNRFDAVWLAGDERGEEFNLTKAKRLLGWEPRTHLKIQV